MWRVMWTRGGAVVAVALAAACSGLPPGDSESATVAEIPREIVGGRLTTARPEVGYFRRESMGTGCSATLISPRYALTAAHCLGDDYQDTRVFDDFLLVSSDGDVTDDDDVRFNLNAIFSFGNYLNENTLDGWTTSDLAILRLARDVPETLVPRPAVMSPVMPARGASATLMGFGCTARSSGGVGSALKRFLEFTFNGAGGTNNLCSGDSGGPAFVGQLADEGGMWGVASGVYWALWDEHDFWSNVAYYKPQVMAQIRDWEGGIEPGFDRPGLDYALRVLTRENPRDCAALCRAEQPRCRAWAQRGTGCLLKDGIPDARPGRLSGWTSGYLQQRTADLEPGIDRGGAIWRELPMSAPNLAALGNLCSLSCAQDPYCRAFSAAVQSDPNTSPVSGRCTLRSEAGRTFRSAGVISAARRGLDWNMERPGATYATFGLSNPIPELCQAYCARDSHCRAWQFDPSRPGVAALCHVKNDVPPPARKNRAISGVKGQEFD